MKGLELMRIWIFYILYTAIIVTSVPSHASGLCRTLFVKKNTSELITSLAERVADFVFSIVPYKKPQLSTVDQVKIIAHRGAHNNRSYAKENTIPAFDLCLKNEIWGIEFDIRWTIDNVPVVHHDPTTGRVFGKNLEIRHITASHLISEIPDIPLLIDIIQRYGKKMHLMMELKETLTPERDKILKQMFSELKPTKDFHVMSLDLSFFEGLHFAPDKALVSIGTTNFKKISEKTLDSSWGGFTGHYALLNDNINASHTKKGQNIGTGQVASKAVFYREIHRNVNWIFTNHALKLRKILDDLVMDP